MRRKLLLRGTSVATTGRGSQYRSGEVEEPVDLLFIIYHQINETGKRLKGNQSGSDQVLNLIIIG